MSKKLKIVAIIGIVGVLSFIAVWKYTFQTTNSSVASEKAVYELNSVDLVSSFETNETDANNLYLGKVILVTGRIDQIIEDSMLVSLNLKETEAISAVMCSFSKENIDLSKISIGDVVKIKGLCTGYLLDVVLNRCAIE